MEWLSLGLLSPSNAGISDFSSYLLGTLFIILLPGPNSLYVLTIAIQKGWRAGAWGAIGIFIGDSILMLAVVLGAASILIASPIIFSLVRALGAAYLAWLGYGLFRNGQRRWSAALEAKTLEIQIRLMRLHPLLAALTLSLTNPKAIFFFVAFFSQFIRADFARPLHTFFYLAIVLQMMSMAYLACLIGVGQASLRFFQSRPRFAAALWMLTGILFMGFAFRLLLV